MAHVPRVFLEPLRERARARLEVLVGDLRAGDPLRPVTVVTPSHYLSLSLRHAFGRAGFTNLHFMKSASLAERLGGPVLAARDLRPLTALLEWAAVGAVAAEASGPLAALRDHPSFGRSLRTTFRELRGAGQEVLGRLERQGGLRAELVRLYRRFREVTGRYYDGEALADAAAEAVRAGSAAGLEDLGSVVLYLVRDLPPAGRRLIEALAAGGGCAAVLGLTGDGEADAGAAALADRLAPALGRPQGEAAPAVPPAAHLLVAPDAREEVRWAVRRIIRAAQDGTPFHRTAIFYRQAEPYASLIQEQLALAGVSAAGPGALSLAGTAVGRSLLGLVRLGADGRFPRDAVTAWVTGCPLAPGSVPRGEWQPARWDALSRRAGVVGGLAQWRERLERYAGELERRAGDGAAGEELSDAAARRLRGDARAARALAAFVADLGVRLRPPGDGGRWRDFAGWAGALLDHYLPRAPALSAGALPDVEAEALGRIERGLDEIAALDALGAPASLPRFTLALDDLLAAPAGRLERFGHGVFVAPLGAAPGLEFDLVHVAGMVEGAVPPPAADDPLLPDEARGLAGGPADGLPLRGAQPADERYAYLAALATAPCRILSFPCADPGACRRRYPSRWVLEAASRLEGAPVGSSALAALDRRPWLTVVASMEGGLAAIPQTAEADLHDHDVYRLWRWRRAGRPLPAHHLAASAPLGRALALERLRAAGEYCEWTGDLSALAATAGRLRPLDGALLSATSLEEWATCPFRYFLGRVLGVEALERPEELESISARDRGTLVHGILRRFVEQVQQDRTLPGPGEPWTDAHGALLVQLARDAFAEAEGRRVTGRALLWEAAKAEVLTDLEAFLDEDARLRVRYGVAPHRAELRFDVDGDEQASPAPVWETPALGPIRFRGAIDRVDLDPAGRLALVLDYKTGKLDAYDGLRSDPVDRGRCLQLPIYALAARAALGDHVRVLAAYWFVGARGGFALRPPDPVDLEAVAAPFGAAVSTIADGISRGLFPANPGKEKRDSFERCQWCDFDPVCGARARRGRLWERLQTDPRLAAYVQLAGGPAQDGSGA